MAFHLKGVKKSTLTDEMRKILYINLQQWVQQTFDFSVSQSIISNTFKRSFEYLSKEIKNNNVKRHKLAKYPELEKKMYGDANFEFNFSISWLKRFKARHGIKYYRRFGLGPDITCLCGVSVRPTRPFDLAREAHTAILQPPQGCVLYTAMSSSTTRPCGIDSLHFRLSLNPVFCVFGILEGYEKGEINPEKINILDVIHFINVAWNIDVKATTIANCFQHYKIRSEEYMSLEQEIGDVEGIHKLKKVISDLHYRSAMDVEQILNYPSENESLMESPTYEEIIQGVMDVPADEEQDPDNSSVLSHVSPKVAFLAVDTLKNYLIQHKKNIPHLVYALLKVKDKIVFDLHAKKK
ncbi:hypothetical protein ES288_A13G130300v1 [Gossypium darwinii]|uniref:HTH CENPB-type domain-containing protein n=1 Tax=Gossypium darwinii TaxID=34276 RepID=A0A5D2DZI6_GOSDA|nr:hypothetical protein ES288_A13G130300v1 [Gossypium darwinii]